MVRFGILGAGNIAHRFATSLAHEERSELVAASCRTQEKAESFLAEVPSAADARAYGGHEKLLEDPDVDAIYLALPHAYHAEWAIAALRAGKAVLCEKPACLNADEMTRIAETAQQQGVLFMEAMKPRFVPLYEQVVASLDKIGPLERVEATLCNDMLGLVGSGTTYHMTPGPGAGVLLDCGIYCASWIEYLCPGTPRLMRAEGKHTQGIDIYVDAWLDYGSMEARLECAFDRAKARTATLVGSQGRIVVDELHRPQHAMVYVQGSEPVGLDAPYEIDDFYGEIRHFVDLICEGAAESPVMSLQNSLRCAQIIDTIRAGL